MKISPMSSNCVCLGLVLPMVLKAISLAVYPIEKAAKPEDRKNKACAAMLPDLAANIFSATQINSHPVHLNHNSVS